VTVFHNGSMFFDGFDGFLVDWDFWLVVRLWIEKID
jgi:hypothetical protein